MSVPGRFHHKLASMTGSNCSVRVPGAAGWERSDTLQDTQERTGASAHSDVLKWLHSTQTANAGSLHGLPLR